MGNVIIGIFVIVIQKYLSADRLLTKNKVKIILNISLLMKIISFNLL